MASAMRQISDGSPSQTKSIAADDNTTEQEMVTDKTDENTVSVEKEPLLPKEEGAPSSKGWEVDMAKESHFHQLFMDPMLSRLEEKVKKNTEFLDELQKQWEQEREEKRKKELSKHIPGPLQGRGQKLEDVMRRIQDLIVYENYDPESEDSANFIKARLKDLDEHAEVSILAHSIAAYVSTLEPHHLRHFTTRIVSDTTLWVSRLFRFMDASACFHDDERDGIVRICRLALLHKYPKYSVDGYEALYPRPPVIYLSAAAKPGLGQFICAQLGLPQSSICTVPFSGGRGFSHKMDCAALKKLILDDIAAARTPAVLVAYAGTPVLGHVDNLQKIQQLCKTHNIWLHIEGNSLATLTMYSVPTSLLPAKAGDSMTVNLSSWLGLPAVPYTTVYRTTDPALAHAAGLSSFHSRSKLTCLPLWLCLQSMGHEGVVEKVRHSISLSKLVWDELENILTIKAVSKKPKPPEKTVQRLSLSELISKAIHAIVIFELETPTIVFQYAESENKGKDKATYAPEENSTDTEDEEEIRDYYDALNIWLTETLRREVPQVHITAIEVEQVGVCIRFAPIETAHMLDTGKTHIDAFIASLKKQLTILDATVNQRENFREIVDAQDNLRVVRVPNWAGLGAVQYIPSNWANDLESLPEAGQAEVNNLNHQLVQQLKSSDTAFSLGQTQTGSACVRFGLITDDTDLEELIALVYTTGKEVEESSKFLETMAEVVKKGIEEASLVLQQENQDRMVQEGVLRQVPLVSSLLNWWSPVESESGVKGRSFNLASGKIESTEGTYRYHMQIQEAAPEPQQKLGPLKLNLKPSRRRQSGDQATDNSQMNGPTSAHNHSLSNASSNSSSVKADGAGAAEAEKPTKRAAEDISLQAAQ